MEAEVQSAGEGKYVKPRTEGYTTSQKQGDGSNVSLYYATGFDEEIALPVEFLKPLIIERTGKAIDLKIFDELAIVYDGVTESKASPTTRTKGDPMVIGRIISGTPNGYSKPKAVEAAMAYRFW